MTQQEAIDYVKAGLPHEAIRVRGYGTDGVRLEVHYYAVISRLGGRNPDPDTQDANARIELDGLIEQVRENLLLMAKEPSNA